MKRFVKFGICLVCSKVMAELRRFLAVLKGISTGTNHSASVQPNMYSLKSGGNHFNTVNSYGTKLFSAVHNSRGLEQVTSEQASRLAQRTTKGKYPFSAR